jgi:hypothetical protein
VLLIESLYLLLKSEKAINKVHSLQFLNKIQSQDLIKVGKDIDIVFNDLTILQSTFDDFDFVIFDTNAFYNTNDSIRIFKHIHSYPHKTILHKSVYAEIKRFALDRKNEDTKPVAWLLANFFLKYFDEANFYVSTELMNLNDIDSANRLDLGKDFADKFLVSLSQEKANIFRTLFVSNDCAEGFRKSKNDSDGPIPLLKEWIVTTGNKNLVLCDIKTFLKDKIKDHNEVKSINKPIVSQVILQTSNLITNKPKKEKLKVKWKDCQFNEKDSTLRFDKDAKSEVIRIGKIHIPDFKKAFDLLKQTENMMELDKSKEGFYTIFQITGILEQIRKTY